MSFRPLILGLLLIGPALATPASEPLKPRIESVETRWSGGRLLVSFRIAEVFSDELLERIESGIPLTLRHKTEVFIPRRLWVDRVIARATLLTTVHYDSLTRQYECVRRVEGGLRAQQLVPGEKRRTTSSLEEMRDWMTRLDDFPPFDLSTFDRGTRMRVRVESVLGRRWWLLVPTKRSIQDEREVER